MNSKSSRVYSNLLQQNCYVRDVVRICDLNTDSSSENFYYSLDEFSDNMGIKQEINKYPYPITPQYVNSFLDSTDYRRDPLGSVSSGGTNLGDIRFVQDVSKLSASEARSLYAQLCARFATKNNDVNSSPKGGTSDV